MTLPQAVDFFCRIMRNLFNVGMAPFTFYPGMYTVGKDMFVNIKKPEFAFFTYPAEAGIFVA